MRNKNILITGGLGFIFSHVAEHFAVHNKVTVLDNLSDGSHPELLPNWKGQIDFIQSDINEIEKFNQSFDVIIHAAAESNVDKSINDQKAFLHSNINGTLRVLDFARGQTNLSMLLYVNTDEVYGSTEQWRDVGHVLRPANPYSASKAAGGHLCWSYANTYGLPISEVRMCNIIGKRQADTKLLPRLIDRIAKETPMPIYDGGGNTREYLDVRDAVQCIDRVMDLPAGQIHNLTVNQELSIKQVMQAVERILGKKAITYEASRPGHDKHYRMVASRVMYDDVGFKMKYLNVEDTIRWMLN